MYQGVMSLWRIAGHEDDVVYMQAYTTNKALIQHIESGRHGLTLEGKAALNGTPPRYMDSLYRVYFDASNTHTSAARLEFRVPLSRATDFATDFPEYLMERTLCVFPTRDWW